MTLTPTPSYTPSQLKALVVLQRTSMAWYMFWFLLITFSIGFGTFIYLVLCDKGSAAQQVSVFVLDGIIGWTMKTVVAYLFPNPANTSAVLV